MREIVGNTITTPVPRPDWNQTDETKADYIKNKPITGMAQTTGDSATDVMSQKATTEVLHGIHDSVDRLGGRIAVLEEAAIGNTIEYSEASEISYKSTVPDDALPYAAIKSVGGMSYRAKNILPFPYGNAHGTTQVGGGMTRTIYENGEVRYEGSGSVDHTFWLTVNADGFVPTVGTYTLSGCPSGGSDDTYFMRVVAFKGSPNAGKYIDYGEGVTFEVTSEMTALAISFVVKANTEVPDVVRPQLEYGSTKSFWLSPVFKNELLHAGVAKVNSYDATGRLVDSVDIPEEVQKLDGYSYGVCNSYNTYDKYNEVDFISGKFTKRCSFSTVKSTRNFKDNSYNPNNDPGTSAYLDDACPGSVEYKNGFVSSAFNNYVQVMVSRVKAYALGTAAINYGMLFCVSPTSRLASKVKAYLAELEAAGKQADFVYALYKPNIKETYIEPVDLIIEVAPGGYLEFVNEHALAVPHTVIYQTKIGGASV